MTWHSPRSAPNGQARQELKATLGRWNKANFSFKLDWLLRNINTVVTGRPLFTALKDVEPAFAFQQVSSRPESGD
ncbi:MAG: hypothetical protein U0841_26885 [Chloroflexia bacterium]